MNLRICFSYLLIVPVACAVSWEVVPRAGVTTNVHWHTRPGTEMRVPESRAVVPEATEVSKQTDSDAWPENLFAWDASPVDLSFLNAQHRPAGKNGGLRVEGERLVFEDGAVARFWGVNLQASALFQTKAENISIHAKRLAQLGINLVRIHHHDSPWVNPNVFGDYGQVTSTHILNVKAMRMLDRWIYALKQEGIYLWLDLHVQRNFKAGDNIEHFDELAAKTKGKGKGRWTDLKGYSYLNKSITERMQEFTKAYLSHVNEFTGVAYRDEPAVIGVLITNENDVTHHFGNRFLPDKDVPEHNKLFDADRKAFSMRSGIPLNDTFNTWEPGPSKIYLNDLEHRWNMRMLAQLRTLGVSVPVATTSLWGGNPAFSLPALADSTIMDTHAYASSEELAYDPRRRASFLTQSALAAIAGKPVSISEWNLDRFPVRDRFSIPISVAAISSLQGWDAAMLYGYSQRPLNGLQQASNWSSYNDPAIMGIMPVAALMFRRGDVRIAKRTYCLNFNRDTLFYRAINAETSATLRTLIEQHRFVVALPRIPELPWLKATPCPKGAEVVTDVDRDFVPAGQQYIVSDTGEVRRDWAAGLETIDTPGSQVAVGGLGGNRIELTDVVVAVTTPKGLVSVQSLVEDPIVNSSRILLTVMAQVKPSGVNNTPFRSQPLLGTISVRARSGLQLRPLDAWGKRGDAITVLYERGYYVFSLPSEMPTHWYELGP